MSNFELRKPCSFCHEVGTPHYGPKPFKRCSKCHLAYYCSDDCQRKAWHDGHKKAHKTHDHQEKCQEKECCDQMNPDSLQMGICRWIPLDENNQQGEPEDIPFHLEHVSVIGAVRSLIPLCNNLLFKGIYTLDESVLHVLHWMTQNLQNIIKKWCGCNKCRGEWRIVSNSLSTLEVLYHYPLNSILRFGDGLFPWWESYIVSFGRVKRAVDLLAALADAGTFHNGKFPVTVVRLVLPEAVVDKRGNNMLHVELAKKPVMAKKVACYNCGHQIVGELRPAFDPKDLANYHEEALTYPLQRPVYLEGLTRDTVVKTQQRATVGGVTKNIGFRAVRELSQEEVLDMLLELEDTAEVFCNYVCDMTVRLKEVDKVTEKPVFYLQSGGRCKDILEARCKTVSSLLNVDDMSRMMGVMAMMGRGEDTGLDGIRYVPNKREQGFLKKISEHQNAIRLLMKQASDGEVIPRWTSLISDLNTLSFEIQKYNVTHMKSTVQAFLGRAYFNRGKLYHGKKNYLKAIKDFERVWALFTLEHQTRNTPPYKIKLEPDILKEGMEAKCRLAEIYARLGNVKTALSEAEESATCVGNVMAMGIRVDTIEKRIDKVCQDLFDLPLLINVATLAKKKTDKALSYFGCDWQPFLVKKVYDLKHQPSLFEETSCHSVTFLDNKLYIIGGTSVHDAKLDTYRPRNQFWVLDLGTREMQQLAAPKKVVCRNSHSCVAHDGCLYVYGGDHAKAINMTENDHKATWKYCVAENTWTRLSTAGDSPLTTGHGACVVGGKMYIFGGQPVTVLPPKCERTRGVCLGCVLSSDSDLNDLHCLDLETLQWNKLSGTGTVNPRFLGNSSQPEGRHYPIMWSDEVSQRIFVLSGAGHRANVPHQCSTDHSVYEKGNFHFKDFWQFSVDDSEWTKLKLHGNYPVARGECQAASVKGGAVIFGGYTVHAKAIIRKKSQYLQESQYLQDSFEFRYDKMSFRQIYTSNQPNPRAMFGLVADPVKRDQVYLVGGRGNTGGLSSKNLAKGKKVKNNTAKAPRGHTLLEGVVYGDIWQLDLTAGEEPGINVEEARSQQYCKVCNESSSSTRLYQCSRCRDPATRYCSKACITEDWDDHKKTCLDVKEHEAGPAGEKEKHENGGKGDYEDIEVD